MGLSVVTLTRPGERHKWFEQAISSVHSNLPDGAKHHVITFKGNDDVDFARARFDARELDDYICFVDDDDLLIDGALEKCWQAINSQGASFTNESLLFPDMEMPVPIRPIRYEEISIHPRMIHHLVILKTALITDEVWALQEKYNVGVEWFMKARCALVGGAVHVPMIGYKWRQHPTSHSHTTEWVKRYAVHMFDMGDDIRQWMKPGMGFIPQMLHTKI